MTIMSTFSNIPYIYMFWTAKKIKNCPGIIGTDLYSTHEMFVEQAFNRHAAACEVAQV